MTGISTENGVVNRFAKAQSVMMIRRWNSPAVAAVAAAIVLTALTADALAKQERPAQAWSHFAHSLAYYRELGDKAGIAAALAGLAGVVGMQGQWERAAQLFGAARALRDASGAPIIAPDLHHYERNVAAVHARLGETAFASAWEAGRRLPLAQALALSAGLAHS